MDNLWAIRHELVDRIATRKNRYHHDDFESGFEAGELHGLEQALEIIDGYTHPEVQETTTETSDTTKPLGLQK
jgi:hypothetical protein